MDSLLASYGSDEEEEEEEEEEQREEREQEVKVEVRLSREPGKVSLFGALPPPRHSALAPPSRSAGSLVTPKSEPVAESGEEAAVEEEGDQKTGARVGGEVAGVGVAQFGDEKGSSGSRSSLFGALPPPKAEFDRFGVKVEGGHSKVKKQVVVFKPPIDASVLEDDDDGWRPAQKRAKAEVGGAAGGGGGLQALLPAPKHGLGLGSGMGGGGGGGGKRRAAMEVAGARSQDVETEPVAVNSRASAPFQPHHAARGEAETRAHGESVHAVDESAAFAPQVPYANETYGWAAPQRPYAPAQETPQAMHDVNSRYERQDWQYSGSASSVSQSSEALYAPANSAPVSDPVAQVLQAERRRGREDKMAAPAVIEVNQADLTGGKVREDQLRTTGIAFGPSYQPVSSSKDKPSKIHRRKHQIGTLLHDMKAREMELLDRRAKGSLTKAETQAKYGW